MRFFLTCACFALLMTTWGCGPAGMQNGPVAVVDVNYLMQQTGQDLAMQQVVQQRVMMLNQQLASMRSSRSAQLQAKQKEIGEEPTDEQKLELQKMNAQFVQEIQQAEMQADQNVGLIQKQFITKFREKISAIATDVAKERGYSMIIAQTDDILTFDTKLDVTELFVERFKSLSTETPADDAPATAGSIPMANPSAGTAPSLQSPAGIPTGTPKSGGVPITLPSKSKKSDESEATTEQKPDAPKETETQKSE